MGNTIPITAQEDVFECIMIFLVLHILAHVSIIYTYSNILQHWTYTNIYLYVITWCLVPSSFWVSMPHVHRTFLETSLLCTYECQILSENEPSGLQYLPFSIFCVSMWVRFWTSIVVLHSTIRLYYIVPV